MERDHWTKEEEEFVLKNYEKMRARKIAGELGKTQNSVKHKAWRLGLQKTRSWTEKEIEILKKLYSTGAKEEILDALPRRSWRSVKYKALKMGLKRTYRATFQNRFQLPDLTEIEWSYLAGLIDGEGHITVLLTRRNGKDFMQPVVGIANSDPEIQKFLDKCHFNLSFESPDIYVKETLIPQRRTIIRYRLYGLVAVEMMLSKLKGYLKAKKKQAELALRYCKIRLDSEWGEPYQEELYKIREKILRLNRRPPF